MKFLLAEDSPTVTCIVVQCITKMFQDAVGFEIKATSRLSEARDLYLTHDPHIVLLDLTLDDASQAVTIGEIPFFSMRADVIPITGDDTPATQKACFSKGASDFFHKKKMTAKPDGDHHYLELQTDRLVSAYARCLYGKRKNET